MGLPCRPRARRGRWTASSIGESFTSIWHRDPEGTWTFYESPSCDVACSQYFGADVARFRVASITLDWRDPHRLHVATDDAAVDWTVELGSTPRLLSAVGPAIPHWAWRSVRE
jgi:hypothetical protein